MLEMPRISVMIQASHTRDIFFRDCLESLVAQTYGDFELYVLDCNENDYCRQMVSEFFPEDDRVHVRQIKKDNRKAYALNIGFHFVFTEAAKHGGGSLEKPWYLFVMDQHDRLAPGALQKIAESVWEQQKLGRIPDFIYSDHDELVGVERVAPHFKPDLNKELLRHCPYIGDCFAVSVDAARKIGSFQEKLTYSAVYDFLLRGVEAGAVFLHIPSLLYHCRQILVEDKQAYQKEQNQREREYMQVVRASLQRQEISGVVEKKTPEFSWDIRYDGKGARSFLGQKEYMLLHEENVRPLTRHNVEKMYGYLRQKDVAVVGARFLKGGFTVENCGFVFDPQGNVYPAFYDTRFYQSTYENLGSIPHDVSMVDFGYCMIDAKVYRRLHGFDARLSGRDLMLDFCLSVRQAGYRVVIDPSILVRRRNAKTESREESHALLLEKWGDVLAKGDPFYNANLPCDLENYRILQDSTGGAT